MKNKQGCYHVSVPKVGKIKEGGVKKNQELGLVNVFPACPEAISSEGSEQTWNSCMTGRMFGPTFLGLPLLASIVCVAGQLFVTQMFWQQMTQLVACSPILITPPYSHPKTPPSPSSIKVSLALPFKTITFDCDLCINHRSVKGPNPCKTRYVSSFPYTGTSPKTRIVLPVMLCVSDQLVKNSLGYSLTLLFAPLCRNLTLETRRSAKTTFVSHRKLRCYCC